MTAAEIGVLLPTREAVVAAGSDGDFARYARLAEEVGFDAVWVGDSPLARPRCDPFVALAAAAGATKHIALGTAVLIGALRHPVLTAQALASLDAISGGRLTVGVGAGFPYEQTQREFAACGVPFARRVTRLDECVEIWRRLWRAEGAVGLDGEFYRVDELDLVIRPAQPGGPPILLAGAGDGSLRRAGARYDGWLPYSPSVDDFAAGVATVDASARAAGRPEPRKAMYLTARVDDEPLRGAKELAAYVDAYYGLPLELMMQLQAFHAGTADECAAWIAAYVHAGADQIIVRLATLDDFDDHLDSFAASVLPAVRAAAMSTGSEGA